MVLNAITEEIRDIRRRLAAKFANDVHQIGAETRRQTESGRRIVRLPSRPPISKGPANKVLNQSGG